MAAALQLPDIKLLFQTFDEKNKCTLIYKKGTFQEQITDNCTKTWSYATYLQDKEVEYANLYVMGKSLGQLCPENLRGEWSSVQTRIKAALKAANEVGLDLNDHCIYELIPSHYLETFAEIKNKFASWSLFFFLACTVLIKHVSSNENSP